jgi:FSR family fosmidomycin resistance protein-like MFS transporter
MRLWAAAHAVDDMYQGLVPASVPYFVLDRHYSYVAASGLTLAATLGSSLPQPVIGLLVDKWRLGWMAAAGVSLAGVGAGLSGLAPAYSVVWLLLLASGLGVAMFHPAAGTSARARAGESASAMSIFAAGGSAGFFLAPVLVTPALVSIGLGATALFIPPALLIGLLLLRHQQRARAAQRSRAGSLAAAGPAGSPGRDRWAPFLVMTGVEVVRSVVFFGVNTFIELYWIHHLGASRGVAGAALACFLVGGIAGTLLGGRIADRLGLVRALQIGTAAMVPTLVALRLCPGAGLALAAAAASGIAVNIPFAVMIKLGQDYLPSRPGTASGVTLGLGVSIGGLIAPVFGAIAEARGTAAVFTVMCFVPVLALVLGALLPDPAASEGDSVAHRVRKKVPGGTQGPRGAGREPELGANTGAGREGGGASAGGS